MASIADKRYATADDATRDLGKHDDEHYGQRNLQWPAASSVMAMSSVVLVHICPVRR